MKILIIEDRKQVSKILRSCLEPVASEIQVAESFKEAWPIIRSVNPLDLITVDLGLPDSEREDTIHRLGDIRKVRPDSVVVVISGFITREDEGRIKEHGADGVLLKTETPTKFTLLEKLAQVARSVVETPQRYKRNLPVAEAMADNFTAYIRGQAGLKSEDIRCCLT